MKEEVPKGIQLNDIDKISTWKVYELRPVKPMHVSLTWSICVAELRPCLHYLPPKLMDLTHHANLTWFSFPSVIMCLGLIVVSDLHKAVTTCIYILHVADIVNVENECMHSKALEKMNGPMS